MEMKEKEEMAKRLFSKPMIKLKEAGELFDITYWGMRHIVLNNDIGFIKVKDKDGRSWNCSPTKEVVAYMRQKKLKLISEASQIILPENLE